jgi:hypothetical protein
MPLLPLQVGAMPLLLLLLLLMLELRRSLGFLAAAVAFLPSLVGDLAGEAIRL